MKKLIIIIFSLACLAMGCKKEVIEPEAEKQIQTDKKIAPDMNHPRDRGNEIPTQVIMFKTNPN